MGFDWLKTAHPGLYLPLHISTPHHGIEEPADRTGQSGRPVADSQAETRSITIGHRRMVLCTVSQRHVTLAEMIIAICITTTKDKGEFLSPVRVGRHFLPRPYPQQRNTDIFIPDQACFLDASTRPFPVKIGQAAIQIGTQRWWNDFECITVKFDQRRGIFFLGAIYLRQDCLKRTR